MSGFLKNFFGGGTSPQPQPRRQPPAGVDNVEIDPGVMWENLYRDGYCILPAVVSKREVDNALREINRSIGKHVPNRENPCPDCTNCDAIQDLYHKSALKGVVDMLIGHHHHVGGGQIALRFPGDNTQGEFEIPPSWAEHWHIDGLGDYESKTRTSLFGDITNFTALIGVVLQDAEEDFMGNLVVYPGSHFDLQNHFQTAGFEDLYHSGVRGLPRIRFARGPKQIHARAGDVVIANYCVAHTIAPNISPFIRYSIYFRVTSAAHTQHGIKNSQLARGNPPQTITGRDINGMKHRPESMLDVWMDWPGLRQHIHRAGKLACASFATSETSSGVAHAAAAASDASRSVPGAVATVVTAVRDDAPTEDDEDNRQLALALERMFRSTRNQAVVLRGSACTQRTIYCYNDENDLPSYTC